MAEKTQELKTANELKVAQEIIKAKDKKIEELEAKLKTAENQACESELTHEFIPIHGAGVIIAFVYGTSLSTIFVPGVKVKDNKVVSINAL